MSLVAEVWDLLETAYGQTGRRAPIFTGWAIRSALLECGCDGCDCGVLEIPDERQDTDYSCGAAAFVSICRYFGVEPDTEDEAVQALGTSPADGTSAAALVAVAEAHDLTATAREGMTLEDLQAATQAGHPVLVPIQAYGDPANYDALEDGHWCVCCGVTGQEGLVEMTKDERGRCHDDKGHLVSCGGGSDASKTELKAPADAQAGVDQAPHHAVVKDTVGRLPEGAQKRIEKNISGVYYAKDSDGVAAKIGDDMGARQPEHRREQWRKNTEKFFKGTHGLYHGETQKLYLSVDPEMRGKIEKATAGDKPGYRMDSSSTKAAVQHLAAHEISHAIDGPDYEISGSPEWKEAYKSEIRRHSMFGMGKPALTKRALEDEREGLAELLRVGTLGNAKQAERDFPKSVKVLKDKGVWPERKTESVQESEAATVHLQDPVQGQVQLTADDFLSRWKDKDADGTILDRYGVVIAKE